MFGSSGRTLVGRHPTMATLAHAIQRVGPTDTTVLVSGESGTGKELVAEAIHEASHRRAGPLVKVNCAALVETLLLSELFGHERGAFTGASGRRRGRFEMAEGGTLFLDEIGDISPRTQVALLRVLQERTYERVGGASPMRANVRVICATHRDLRAMVARGEFREDLYYRLRQVEIDVPALRSRASDIPLIAVEILQALSRDQGVPARRLADGAQRILVAHGWPGNVRELENVLRAAAVFAEGDEITAEDLLSRLPGLEARVASPAPNSSVSPGAAACATVGGSARTPTDVAYAHIRGGVSLHDMKRQIERECVARALAETSGNITKAAGLLGMKRPRLSQLVKQYGMSASADGEGVDE
jgi:sigma-54 specific flagellar transcriptional regulator A